MPRPEGPQGPSGHLQDGSSDPVSDTDPLPDASGARPGPGRRGRALWTIGTQALSSASNFLLSGVVLVVASARAFAVFSICLTTYLLVLQFARNVIGIPVLIHQAGGREVPGDGAAEERDGSAGFAVLSGLAIAPALVLVAAVWRESAPQFLVLAAAMPFLLVQDALRHVAIAVGRPQLAVAADGTWVVLQVVGFAVAIAAGADSPATLLSVWCAAGAVSAVGLGGLLHATPAVTGSVAWLRRNAALCRRLAVEFLVNSGSYYALSYGLVVMAGAGELGHFRAAQTLFGPASVLLMGGAALGVPESVRLRRDGSDLLRLSARLSAALTVLSLVCGLGVYALLPIVGPELFPSWPAVRAVMPWLTLFGAALGAGAGPIATLRALGASRWVLDARTLAACIVLVVGLPASALLGARGAFLALGIGECILAARAWRQVTRAVELPASAES